MTRYLSALCTAACAALLALPAVAQQAAETHHPLRKAIGKVTPSGPVPSLFVLNADGATLGDGKLTLTGVATNSIVFADRPVRSAGHVMTAQFLEQWAEGNDNFAVDPPNATVSVLGGTGSDISDAVVTLRNPVMEGTTLTFDVDVLEGTTLGAGPAALFIDDRGDGSAEPDQGNQAGYDSVGGSGGVDNNYDSYPGAISGNYHHAADYQGAWYRSNDGYAGQNLYRNAGCGDYPLPPCN